MMFRGTVFHLKLIGVRQRIISRIRSWFRLPADEYIEHERQVFTQRTDVQIDHLLRLNEQANEAMKTLASIARQLKSRLDFYEKNIPRMREVGKKFDLEQAKLNAAANNTSEESRQRLADGIVGAISS